MLWRGFEVSDSLQGKIDQILNSSLDSFDNLHTYNVIVFTINYCSRHEPEIKNNLLMPFQEVYEEIFVKL